MHTQLSASQLKERQKKEQSLQSRKQALEVEKERAKRVASANPSLSQMIIMVWLLPGLYCAIHDVRNALLMMCTLGFSQEPNLGLSNSSRQSCYLQNTH